MRLEGICSRSDAENSMLTTYATEKHDMFLSGGTKFLQSKPIFRYLTAFFPTTVETYFIIEINEITKVFC